MSKTEALREWRAKNPEKVRAQQRQQYLRGRDKVLAYQREYSRTNRARLSAAAKLRRDSLGPEERSALAEKRRWVAVQRKYGLDEVQYNAILSAQGGHCALCPRTGAQERYGILNVDHCHESGEIRGLLCTPCNHAIGALGDNVTGLKAALSYLGGSDV